MKRWKDKDTEDARQRRNAIGLILVGVALGKPGDRKRVLDGLPPDVIDVPQIDMLLNAIRDADPEPMRKWLDECGVSMSEDTDTVGAILDEIGNYAVSKIVRRRMTELDLGGWSDTKDVRGQLAELISEIDKVGE